MAFLVAVALLAGCASPVDDATSQTAGELTVCGRGPTVAGIDVAVFDGTIDWNRVHASGRQFAIARISDGLNYPDSTFARNWAGIRAAGMIRGAYQYFEPTQDPVAQADMVVRAVGRLGPGDLPVTADIEATSYPAASTYVARLHAWFDRVRAGTGKAPMIYTGRYYWQDQLGTRDFSGSPLWHAQYTSASCPNIADQWSQWAFWQYTDSGTVPGVPGGGACDLDRFNGTLAELSALADGSASPVYAGAFVSQSFPYTEVGALTMHAGESVPAYIEMRNTGTAPWDGNTRLATTEPRDRASAFAASDWVAPNRLARVSGTVAAGGTYRFAFTLHAPATTGRYDEHFGMVQDGTAWFSDPSQGGPRDSLLEVIINVIPADDAGATDDAGSANDAASTDDADDAGDAGAADDAGDAGADGGPARDAGRRGDGAARAGGEAAASVGCDCSTAGSASRARLGAVAMVGLMGLATRRRSRRATGRGRRG